MSIQLSEKVLKNFYIKKRLSTWKIERITKKSRSSIYKRLKEIGITPRDISESHIRHKRKNFNDSTAEKAYLIGFVIGDLRTRKCGGQKSKTISIGCGSTRPAQIKLIERLFSPYGHIWKGRSNGHGVTNIEAFVDLSFSFLLPHRIKKYNWIFRNKKYFLSFLAGFTDAEGSIFITKKNQATLAWGNYDYIILKKIKKQLEKMNIAIGNVVSDHLKGYEGKDGYVRKANYYHLASTRKQSLVRLLNLLKPLLQHADKKRKLISALKNIWTRNKKYGFLNVKL